MMGSLETFLLEIFTVGADTGGHPHHRIIDIIPDLVKRQPVADLAAVAIDDCPDKFHIEFNPLPVIPSAIFFHQCQRHFIMGNRDHDLHVLGDQFVKHCVIELQAGFIGCFFLAGWINSRPGN